MSHVFCVSTLNAFDHEEDPNGSMRIFGIGTLVQVPTGETGKVVGIGRSTLKVKVPNRPVKSYPSHMLEIV
jgi:hypothetical protein